MRRLRFYKVSPGGNATILILDPVSFEDRVAVARRLLDEHHLQAEQVGFLNLDAYPARLDMMGGEFCGNACRAAAAVMFQEERGLVPQGGDWAGALSVSGVNRILKLRVLHGTEALDCWVEMPMPETGAVTDVGPGIGLVRLPGIAHLCLDEAGHPFPAEYGAAAERLRNQHGLERENAVGCIWYHPIASGFAIRPVVWVRSTASTFYETGCGSGSLALALWLRCGRGQNFPPFVRVVQPSGREIGVRLDAAEDSTAWIFGPVVLIARGETWV